MKRDARATSRGRRLACVAFAACGLGACNLIAGFESDYELRPGTTPGDDAADAANADGASDGAIGNDGAGDAGLDVQTDGRFCEIYGDAANVTWCSDFEGTDVGPFFGWENYEHTHGDAGVEDGIGVGGSRGFRASVTDAGSSARVLLLVGGASFLSYTTHELSFAMKVTVQPTTATCVLGTLGFKRSNGTPVYTGISVWKGPNVLDISDTPGGAPTMPFVSAPGSSWHQGKIRFERDGGSPTYQTTVTVDSTVVDSARLFNAGDGGPTQVLVGAFYTSADNGSAEAVIDNVLVTQVP